MSKEQQMSDYRWFRDHQLELYRLFPDKYLIISDKGVHGCFDKMMPALEDASRRFKAGDFLIQQATESTEPIRFYSGLVTFNE